MIFNVLRMNGVELWTKPASGGVESELENMPELSYGDSWAATAGGIYYTDVKAKPITVKFHDFVTHTNRVLMTLREVPVPTGPWLGVSPDGRWLLYTQVENEQSEILLAPAP